MKKNLHLLLFVLLSVAAYAQPAYDDCNDAMLNTQSADDSFDETFQMNFTTDEGNFSNIGITYNQTGFITLNWTGTTGYYTIQLATQGSNAYNFSYDSDQDCMLDGGTTGDQLYEGSVSTVDIPCFYFENGTDYTFGFAADIGGFEELQIQVFSEAPAYNVCSGAISINGGTAIPNTCQLIGEFNGFFDDTCPTDLSDPDYAAVSSCGSFGGGEDIWFEFTLDANSEVNITYTVTAIATPILTVYSGSCDGGLSFVGCGDGSDNNGDSNPDETFTLMGGTQYYLSLEAVGGAAAGSGASIFMTSTPLNNDCANAEVLSDGIQEDGTNACATPADNGYCLINTTDSHVVYYQYTVTGTESYNLDITINGNSNTAGFAATDIQIELFQDCAGTLTPFSADLGDPCAALGATVDYKCVTAGTYIIAVGSPNGTGGDFDITVDQNLVGTLANDGCNAPDNSVSLNSDCTVASFSGTTVGACPETFSPTGCDYTMQSVVWHLITMPAGGIGIEISNIVGTSNITVFTDNACPPTAVFADANCITSDATIPGMAESTSYLIGVSSDFGSEAPYSFDILAIVPPANDECAGVVNVAEDITATAAVGAAGTTSCATSDINVCTTTTDDHVVWYSYTVQSGTNVDLDFTLTPSGANPAGDVIFAVYTDCNYALLDPTVMSCTGDNLFECVTAGEQIFVAVSSTNGNEGDFTIQIEEINPAPSNDACTTPTAITFVGDCQFVDNVSVDNVNACPESFTGSSCDFDGDAIVWFEVTLPANAVGLEFADFTGGYVAVFNNDCTTLSLAGTLSGAPADCISTDASIFNLTGGATYLIGAGQAGVEGAFTFDILPIVPPSNDECDGTTFTAEDISGTASGGVAGSTSCATADGMVCGLDAVSSHVVWYEYMLTSTVNVDIEITVAASGASPATSAVLQGYSDCTYTDLNPAVDACMEMMGTTVVYECVNPDLTPTIFIAVGSPDGDEGDFTITINETNPAPVNDACDGAVDIPITAACTWIPVNTNNTDACPETPLLDGISTCELDEDAVVWHSVTLPGSAVGIGFQNFSANAYAAVFSGPCSAPMLEEDCVTANDQVLDLTGGDTYYIAVAQTGGAVGPISFEIRTISPQSNDICDPDAQVLTSGVTVQGSTACATPNAFEYCGLNTTNSHTVYYSYTVQSTKNSEITIDIANSSGTTGNPATDIFLGVWTDCNGTDFPVDPVDASGAAVDECNPDVAQTLIYECVPPGTVLTIAVGSSDPNDGDFAITITEDDTGTPDNDLCSAAEVITPTPLDPICEWIAVQADSEGACPENFEFANGCGFDDWPVVWMSFETPAGAASVEIDVISTSIGNPLYAIFEDGPDCNNLVNISDCETGFGEISTPAPVNGGQTYLIGIGVQNADGGTIDFNIKVNVPPANDDPCDAETLAAGIATMGTNLCATGDFTDPNCPMVQGEASVWYTYTLGASETGVEITFPSITATGPINAFVVEFDAGCTNTPTLIDNDATTCDAANLTDPIVVNCIDPGTQLWIGVASEDANAGDFEIQIDPIDPDPACIDNDECDMAQDEGVITTDDDCAVITDCNENACAEFIGDCGIEINNVVWYSVTNDGTGEFISAGVENADFDEPVIMIFSGSCGALVNTGPCEFGAGGVANAGPFMIPADGTQYWIAVGSIDAVGGNFDLCIEINSGCVNDELCDGVELFDGVPVDNPASTVGCTMDLTNPDCAVQANSTVWYTFLVPPGAGAFEIQIENNATSGITGDISIQVGPYSDANCANPPEAFWTNCQPGSQQHEIPCTPEGGEYYIQIASQEDMDEGDFTITVTAVAPDATDPPAPTNDICSLVGPNDMFTVTPSDYCTMVGVTGTTINACPELIFSGACEYNENPTVWMSIEVPNDPEITTMDVLLEDLGGLSNPMLAVITIDCDDPTNTGVEAAAGSGCIQGDAASAEMEGIAVTPGTTYYFMVSSSTGAEGDFVLNVQLDVPPENDNPCPTDMNPPIDLSGGGGHAGTTCCARGANDDPSFDYANVDCAAATDDDVVWYTYTPNGIDDGIVINTDPGAGANGIMGNTAIEVYTSPDPNGGCTGNLTLVASDCAALPSEIAIPVCDPNVTFYVKVGSAEDDCGTFNISITDRSLCDMADECDEIGAAQMLGSPLQTDPNFEVFYEECIPGCLALACPETAPPGSPCVFLDNPTVWFQIETDDLAAQLFTSVTTDGSWMPIWSIYFGDDCNNLTQFALGNTPPCSDGDDTPTLHQSSIEEDLDGNPITTYWVAVSGEGVFDDPTFELCAYTTINALVCLGDIDDNCNADPSLELEIIDREFADGDLDPDGDGLAGPFCQGEELTVSLSYFYDATESGADWLIGMIPQFGPGWNTEDFDYDAAAASVGAEYFDEDGPCAPLIQEGVPHLCTYEDDDGNLVLCNALCEACPCTPGMVEQDPLPSGWFWLSTGGSSGCTNDCSPGEAWGIGSTTSQIDMEFTITVGEFMDAMECAQNNDLQISFQTFSDGVAGCWEDPVGECLIDRKQFGPLWKIECEQAPGVIATPQPREICNGGAVDIDVVTDDGTATTIEVTFEDNPNVLGENNHTFPAGSGTVDDILTLADGVTTEQTVVYTAFTIVDGLICPGVPMEFEVTIYPALEITFNDPLEVCDGFSVDVEATANGGTGNYVSYQWGPNAGNATTPVINVTPVTTTTYCITVTDDLGCTGENCVEVFWNPPVEFELVPSTIAACQNGVEENLIVIDVNVLTGTAPYDIDWDVDPGFNALDYTLNNNAFDNGQLTVNEETSESGVYTIFVFIEDDKGCISEEMIEIEIGSQPFIVTQPLDVPCGGSGENVTIVTSAFETGTVPIESMCLTDCDGILIFEQFGNSATWEVDPNDFDCLIIVAKDANGCMGTEEINLDTNAGPEPEVTGSSHCIGETSTVDVVDPSLYTAFEWNSGEMTSSIVADRDTAFIYVVTVTDENGCTGATSFEVTVDPIPAISLAGSLSFCEGSNTTLTASGGAMYEWIQNSSSTTVSNTADVTIDMAGSYTVIVTNAEGCESDSTIMVISDDNLNVTLNDLLLCDGDIDTLSAGESFATYAWEDSDGNSLGSDYFIEVGAGTYCVTVTDMSGCTGETCKEVLANTTPVAEVTPFIEVCREDNGIGSTCIDFNAQVIQGMGTWVDLDVSGVDLSNLADVCFDGIARDTYYFEFRTNDALAPCENVRDTMCVSVINCDCPSVDLLGPESLCNTEGTTFDLDDLKNTLEDGSWTPSSGNPLTLAGSVVDVSGVAAGEYFFTFTLDNPVGTCPDMNETSIIVIEEAIAVAVDNSVCNANTGNGPTTIDLASTLTPETTSGGIWTDAGGAVVDPTLLDFDGETPNTEFVYTYTVAGEDPCGEVSTDVTITVIDCDCPQVMITDPEALCNDDDSIDLDDYVTTSESGTWEYVSGGTGGAVALEAGNVFNATGLSSGLYVFNFVLDNDPGGDCETEFPINIIVSNQPVVMTVADGFPCNDPSTGAGPSTVDLTQLIAGSGTTTGGTWMQTGGPTSVDISTPTNVDFIGLDIGAVYTFEFTTTTALIPPCANVSTEVTVTVQDCECPNVDVAPPAPLCNTTTIDLATLEGPMIGDGNWTVTGPDGAVALGGPDGTTLDLNGVTAGDYSLTYTLDPAPGGLCQTDSTVTLSVSEQLFATLDADQTVCVNDGSNGANFIDFTSLIIAGDTGGTWTDVDGAGVDLAGDLSMVVFEGVTPDMSFTFEYSLDSDDPCDDPVYTIEILTDPCDCPLANPDNPNTECSDAGVVDLSQYDNDQFSGTWSSTELTITGGNSVDLTGVAAGDYTLSYTMDDPVDGCQDTWDVTITVINPANPGMALEELIFCADESEVVDLFDRLDGEDAGGMWMEVSAVMSTGGAFNSDGSFDITGQAAGTYAFEYIITGNDPCPTVMETVEITIEAVPTADAGADELLDCNVTSATLGGPGTTTAGVTYLWTEAGGAPITGADQAQITVTAAGTYTLLVEDTQSGCASMDEVIVTVSDDVPNFELEFGDISCNGANDGFINIVNPSGGNGDYSYSFNGGAFSSATSFTNLDAGTYTIVMEDSSGSGCTSEQSVTLVEPNLLLIDIGAPQQVTVGDIVNFSIADQIAGYDIDNIVWTVNGEVVCSDPTCTSISITADDNANVDVVVTYNGGCIAQAMSQVLVIRVVDVTLPNVISPNGDNQNDVFFVNSDDVELVLKTLIYDRWGELVYSSANHPAQDPSYGWDGTFKGKKVNPGVFVYVVEILYKNNAGTEIFSGDVTIVR